MYKFPSFDKSIHLAEVYATESMNYTHDYPGYENESGTTRKFNRIKTGRFGQEWLYDYCKFNNIPCNKDESSPQENDTYDLIINNIIVDVKTSISIDFLGQVSPGCIHKSGILCFMLTNYEFSYIEPMGWISFKNYREKSYFVGFDEEINGTGIKNKFKQGSYFIDMKHLEDFFKVVSWFMYDVWDDSGHASDICETATDKF